MKKAKYAHFITVRMISSLQEKPYWMDLPQDCLKTMEWKLTWSKNSKKSQRNVWRRQSLVSQIKTNKMVWTEILHSNQSNKYKQTLILKNRRDSKIWNKGSKSKLIIIRKSWYRISLVQTMTDNSRKRMKWLSQCDCLTLDRLSWRSKKNWIRAGFQLGRAVVQLVKLNWNSKSVKWLWIKTKAAKSKF